MRSLVVDTSVIIKWFRRGEDEPYAELARSLLRDFVEGRMSLSTPDLAVYEFGNVLTGLKKLPSNVRSSYLADFWHLGLRVVPIDEALSATALDIATADGTTYYDAAFVALAENLKCGFVTADEPLYAKTPSRGTVLLRDLRLT